MILDKFRVDGQVAVVTGGTKGLGRASAVALAEAGADIVAVSRKPDDDMEKTVRGLGRRYAHIAADLTVREETKKIIPEAVKALGSPDILINNAGIIRRAPAAEYTDEDWDATVEIDLSAAFILSRDAGKIMLEKGRGKIVNIASILAFQGGINVTAYAAAKHGIVGLTKALSNDWAKKGINVNTIAPSFFVTELTAPIKNDPVRSESITGRTPAGRWGEPEDLAGAVVFLSSPASDFVHGVTLPVDGGWLAW